MGNPLPKFLAGDRYFPQQNSKGAKRSRSGVPQRGGNLCFPIPLQSTLRLQAKDQDQAAGREAKNSHRTNSKELAGLVARETSRRESN